VRFEARLSALRDRRAEWRGKLYDATLERENIIRSHLQLHGMNYRAQDKLGFWRDKSGLDGWMIGFFVLMLLVNVGYIVFITFPSLPAPTLRALLPASSPIEFDYRIMINVSLFVVVGMSFWMAAPKRFQWSALSVNLLLVGWAVVWGLLMIVFFQWAFITGFKQVPFFVVFFCTSIHFLHFQIPFTAQLGSLSLYAAAAVLVSHAVLLGRIDARQGMVMATLECIAFAVLVNFQQYYRVNDTGGAVSVFIYGGIVGLSASFIYAITGNHHQPDKPGHQRNQNKTYNEELKLTSQPRRHSYRSGGFSWIGTLVLWSMWPMFNAAFAPGNTHGRVVATTFTALLASCCTSVALSYLLHGGMKEIKLFFRNF
jgi:hypothetical protein